MPLYDLRQSAFDKRCLATSLLFVITAFTLGVAATTTGQEQVPNRRDVTIVAHETEFTPSRIEVAQDDLVRVTFKSDREPRTLAIDAYRISKRAGGGQTIVFEFRTDQPGTFTFYCNLTSFAACRDMKGTLVVNPK